VPGERPPGEKTGAVAEVQDQQDTALRSEAPEPPALQGGQQVVIKDWRFANGVNADLGQLPPLAYLAELAEDGLKKSREFHISGSRSSLQKAVGTQAFG
jgi:hypothetical protein